MIEIPTKTKWFDVLFVILITICIILLFTGDLFPQVNDRLEIKFRVKDWNKSEWTSYDKYVHCAGGWILTGQLDKGMVWWKAFLLGQACSIAWEVKDGFIKWEKIGFWGGDGFDAKDHITFTVGQLGQGLMDHVLFKKSIYSARQKMNNDVKSSLNTELYQ